jgi:hypothetical protein
MSHSAMPIATDPLGAIRMELVGAARRRKMARRRRKRVSTTAAVGFATLAMAAGATAVMDVSTGVPAIDKTLQIRQNNAGPSQDMADDPRLDPLTGNLQVADIDNAVSPALEAPWGSGSVVGVKYVSTGGIICLALAETDGEGVSEARGQVGDCATPTEVSQRLADDTSFVSGIAVGETLVINGFAREDVEELRARGPSGPLSVRMSDVWSPDVAGAQPMRVFLAYGAVDTNGDGRRDVRDSGRLLDPAVYTLEARLEDGRTLETGP